MLTYRLLSVFIKLGCDNSCPRSEEVPGRWKPPRRRPRCNRHAVRRPASILVCLLAPASFSPCRCGARAAWSRPTGPDTRIANAHSPPWTISKPNEPSPTPSIGESAGWCPEPHVHRARVKACRVAFDQRCGLSGSWPWPSSRRTSSAGIWTTFAAPALSSAAFFLAQAFAIKHVALFGALPLAPLFGYAILQHPNERAQPRLLSLFSYCSRNPAGILFLAFAPLALLSGRLRPRTGAQLACLVFAGVYLFCWAAILCAMRSRRLLFSRC